MKKFKEDWGEDAIKAGFLQVPNSLLRCIGSLDLKHTSALVLFDIMSYGERRQVSAGRIAQDLGMSRGTVRACFRELQSKKLIHRNFQIGEPSSFSWIGLKNHIREYAKRNAHAMKDFSNPVFVHRHRSIQNIDTNKDINTKDLKEGDQSGYKLFQAKRAELKKRKQK